MSEYIRGLKLDIITCILGLGGGAFIMGLYLKSPTVHLLTLGGALFFASLAYLILSRINDTRREDIHICKDKSTKNVLEAAFLILFAISLVTYHASENRTIFYFISISLCTGIVALLCAGVTKKRDVIIQIVNIIVLSLNIKLAKFYFFGGSGVDYWIHLKMNEMLSQLGNIGVLSGKEQFFPIMHIDVALTQIMLNLPVKGASMISIILPLVISSICVYFIGRELFGEKIGLLGMLIVNISDYQNWWGFAPQTTSYGAIIFFFSVFAIYKLTNLKNKKNWLATAGILMFAMIIAHAISSFILFTALVGLITGSFLYTIIFSEKGKFFFPALMMIYAIGLMQHWFIAEYRADGPPFFDQIVATLSTYVTEHAGFLNRPEAAPEYAALLPPLSESLVNNLGLALLIFLAVIGALYWLSFDFRSRTTFSILVCTTLLLGITFVFPLFGIRNIIPHRWFVFEYLFLAIMAAFAIIHISMLMSRKQQICVIFVVFTCLSFFMLTATSSNLANLDSPLWLKESTISTTYTIQEMKGAETISCHSERVFSDLRYGVSIIGVYYGHKHDPFDSMDLSDRSGSVFIWRRYMENRPIRMFTQVEGYYKQVESNVIPGPEYLKELEKMQRVYENDDVSGYYIS
ncbi:hypothetical protein Metli_0868 [Methanofollis liminatans DSM 4140]|uniref:Glycosyltransferase RgtA/B/C/D-like domain-containing protein n=1 Tax=Methanofollis liminatans DSM 4140 TaxID=28892 RepID=J0RZ69_9EURY|nr:hypothetical protein [Methanofollis liminatans]EJG06826.1 hypothetical protein Metli_0868 [Methanofollis liminatans DSM 4140]